ncbi:hypothetical protein [Sorangium sp. So ce426]|uniref:hypothetical protein n=1 Tax=unclassified Sorangium TaxID=2621164 RepID=UPI003F5C3E58
MRPATDRAALLGDRWIAARCYPALARRVEESEISGASTGARVPLPCGDVQRGGLGGSCAVAAGVVLGFCVDRRARICWK